MILKALYNYYHAVKDMPPLGMDDVEIAYIIVIDKDGNLKRIESTKKDDGNYASFLVAKNVDRSSDITPKILYDNAEYALGLCKDTDAKKRLKAAKKHESFIQKTNGIAEHNPNDRSLQALNTFLKKPTEVILAELEQDTLYKEITNADNTTYITFQLSGEDEIIAGKARLYQYLIEEKYYDSQAKQGICLITGNKGPIARTISKIKLPFEKSATMVGAQVSCGYDSYGKEQAFNSPISLEAEFAFTTALNALCKNNSKNNVKIGNRSFIYWCSKRNQTAIDTENGLYSFLGLQLDSAPNDPNKGLNNVHKVFNGIWSGEIKTVLDDHFYMLCMYKPSDGRNSVVSWSEMPLKDLAHNIICHMDDMEIVDYRKKEYQRPYCGAYNILKSIAINEDLANVPSSLAEGVIASIVNNVQYPFSLYTAALIRIRANLSIPSEQAKAAVIDQRHQTISRMAILKAYIKRSKTTNIKLNSMLDKNNSNPGYLCGRLAAVLEKIQSDASCGDSIRTRYMGAASATPSAVFPTMLSVSIHHSEKIEKDSIRIFYEKLKAEILSKLPATGFPTHINLIDQGCFFIGYYHQRADLYTAKTKDETIENNN